jgi:two-component system sensor histidine kinase/response regulator
MTFYENKIFKILVVDDNMKNIKVLGNILREKKYIIGYAVDGLQAVELLIKDNDYDLVLLDVDMPVMNGYEACETIKMSEKLKEIPVIFLTAFNDNHKILKGFDIGAQDYITKPYNAQELLKRVDTHLQLKYKTDQLKMMNSILEQKVNERTKELTLANERLELLDKAKSDFLALISHEMRTPLNGIVGFSELLKSMVQDPELKKFTDYLLDSAERLTRFSEMALLITSLKLNNYDFFIENFSLDSLLNNVINNLQNKINEKTLKIVRQLNTDDHNIAIDESLMRFSVKSILENAIHYSNVGESIIISVSQDKNYIKLSIRDFGPGFSDEAMAKIFEIFTIVNIMHHTEGLGLSLATIKMITELHKGIIEVKNMNKGAEVSLFIPIDIKM